VQTPLFRSYLRLLQRTAALFDQLHSPRVALELMDEPPVAADAWQPMLDAGYAAARRGSADLLLVLEGGNEASAPALMQMQTARFAGDPSVLYAFHYYEPYQFTHQGASWNPARYLADVPYPANARPLQDSLDASAAAIADTSLSQPQKALAKIEAQMRLRSYVQSGFDGAAIGRDFDQIAGWARSQGLSPDKILLGEFGARETELQRDGARAAERAQWFRDVSRQAADHGFGWAVWAYRGDGGFALAKSAASNEIEPDIADALGLKAAPRAEGIPDGSKTLSASTP
jgi:endoglucanase